MVSKRSRVVPSNDIYAVSVGDTTLGTADIYDAAIASTAPPSDTSRSFTFNILPTVSSELHLPSVEVLIGVKLVKEDLSAIDSNSHQVGIIQTPGGY